MKERSPNQIIRMDGRSKFVEVLNSSFPIGKVEFGFRSYDVNRPTKSRITGQIDIYMDIPVFLQFAHDALYGRFRKMLAANPNEPAFTDMGGVTASRLAGRNQERADHMCLSRQLKLMSGKNGYLMVAEQGAGKEDNTGLIVPQYGNSPEVKIPIPFNDVLLERLVLAVQFHLQAYLAAKYVYAEGDRRREEKQAERENAGQPAA